MEVRKKEYNISSTTIESIMPLYQNKFYSDSWGWASPAKVKKLKTTVKGLLLQPLSAYRNSQASKTMTILVTTHIVTFFVVMTIKNTKQVQN